MRDRTYHDHLETALDATRRFDGRPDIREQVRLAIEAVVRLSGTERPVFYTSSGGSFVGVLADDGRRLARIEGGHVRARVRAHGFYERTAESAKPLPDANLPYRFDLSPSRRSS